MWAGRCACVRAFVRACARAGRVRSSESVMRVSASAGAGAGEAGVGGCGGEGGPGARGTIQSFRGGPSRAGARTNLTIYGQGKIGPFTLAACDAPRKLIYRGGGECVPQYVIYIYIYNMSEYYIYIYIYIYQAPRR